MDLVINKIYFSNYLIDFHYFLIDFNGFSGFGPLGPAAFQAEGLRAPRPQGPAAFQAVGLRARPKGPA